MASRDGNYRPAIQILTADENIIQTIECYENGPSLANVLCDKEHEDMPMLVFSITGKTRGGKSFLLNLAAKYLEHQGDKSWMTGTIPNVFEWNAGLDSVTRGLWICPKIYKPRNQTGKKVGILLMDNQGLFDGEAESGESVAMSGISTAISTYQIYNIKDKICSDNLEAIWGTQENKKMWENLLQIYPNIKCLPLPHPGNKVTKKKFKDERTLNEIDEEFMSEIDKFFNEIFDLKTLYALRENQDVNFMTGREIYNCLMKCNGTRTDNNCSFLMIFTEHGNEEKLKTMETSFQSRLILYNDDPSRIAGVMDTFLTDARRRFKGNSATEYCTKLEMFMTQKINITIQEWILSKYKEKIRDVYIEENHKAIWPFIRSKLNLFVGSEEHKQASSDFVVKEAANIYYKNLSEEKGEDFKSRCRKKKLKELAGYGNQYIYDNFRQNFYFNVPEGKAIWLAHKFFLQEKVDRILLMIIAKITGKTTEWLQEATKQQYEHFEVLTWGDNGRNECTMKFKPKNEQCLKKFIAYALFKNCQKLSEYTEQQSDSIQKIADNIIENRCYDSINLSLVFVVYRDDKNKTDINDPVFKVQTLSEIVFVDSVARVYKNWEDYMEENKLPECVYCYPLHGEYSKMHGFRVGFEYSPACRTVKRILSVVDKIGDVVAIASVGTLMFASAVPIVAVAVGGAVVGGTYGLTRNITKIYDKVTHNESVNAEDVVDTAGNSLTVLSAGASVAVATLMRAGKEVSLVKSGAKLLSSLTGLIFKIKLDSKDNTSLIKEISDISVKMLFYFNSELGKDALENIRKSYDLGNVSNEGVLKALIDNNSIELPTESDKGLEVRQFVSTGFKSLISELLKFIDSDAITLQPEVNSFGCEFKRLFNDFKIESTNLNSALLSILNSFSLSETEDLNLLKECFCNSKEGDRFQFSLLLRNLIYSISRRMTAENRFYNSIEHEGHRMMGYSGVEFHPVEEVFDQIHSTPIIKKGSEMVKCLDNKRLCSVVKYALDSLCKTMGDNWNLCDFTKCLDEYCFLISEIFDNYLKSVRTQLQNQFPIHSCDQVDSLLSENGISAKFVSSLMEKSIKESIDAMHYLKREIQRGDSARHEMGETLRCNSAMHKMKETLRCDSIMPEMEALRYDSVMPQMGETLRYDSATHQMGKARRCDSAEISDINAVIVPAWNDLLGHTFCYSVVGKSEEISFKDLINILFQKPMIHCEEQEMGIFKVKIEDNESTYYVYRSQIDGEECGMFFIDE